MVRERLFYGLLVLSIAQTGPLHALDITPDHVGLLRKVAIIGPTDERRLCEELAEQKGDPGLVETFRATGLLRCGGNRSAANLVGRNDLILFTAHTMEAWTQEGGECRQTRELPACSVTFSKGNTTETFDVDMTKIRFGSDCPLGP